MLTNNSPGAHHMSAKQFLESAETYILSPLAKTAQISAHLK
jgi:hypothetical protein